MIISSLRHNCLTLFSHSFLKNPQKNTHILSFSSFKIIEPSVKTKHRYFTQKKYRHTWTMWHGPLFFVLFSPIFYQPSHPYSTIRSTWFIEKNTFFSLVKHFVRKKYFFLYFFQETKSKFQEEFVQPTRLLYAFLCSRF